MMPPREPGSPQSEIHGDISDVLDLGNPLERAVVKALRAQERQRLQDSDMHQRTAKRFGWLQVALAVVGALVTAVGSAYAVIRWYGDKVVSEHDAARQLDHTSKRLDTHEAADTSRFERVEQKVRNVGALQIEQGNDQRSILLDAAPKAVQQKHKEKPPKLQAAEAAVLRD